MRRGKLAVVGVPSAAGARSNGVSRGSFALREAGLLEGLRATGATVVNLSDLSLFPFRAGSGPARNAEVVCCAARAAADEMGRALREGFTILLGGDCSLVSGFARGAQEALGGRAGLVYLDANADLNTEETSPSGYLNGMGLSLALGFTDLDPGLPHPLRPGDVALLGFRELDPAERPRLAELGLALPAEAMRRLGMGRAAALALNALDGAPPLVVHLDVDLLDPSLLQAKDAVTPGEGLTWEQASELLSALLGSGRVKALEVAEFNPDLDSSGAVARALVKLLVQATAALG